MFCQSFLKKLSELLNDKALRPDFVAMDIKTSPERYGSEICGMHSKFYGDAQHFVNALTESARLVASMPADSREFRTVLVPPLVKKVDIINKYLDYLTVNINIKTLIDEIIYGIYGGE